MVAGMAVRCGRKLFKRIPLLSSAIRSPGRRLRRKTSQEAAAALRDAEQAADRGSAKAGCMVMDSSPRRGVVNDAPDLSVSSLVRRRVREK